MLKDNYFMPGDTVTDGEKDYKINDREPAPYSPFKWPVPFEKPEPGYWVYGFEEKIENCEGKILTKK